MYVGVGGAFNARLPVVRHLKQLSAILCHLKRFDGGQLRDPARRKRKSYLIAGVSQPKLKKTAFYSEQ